ncbi:hypothetical protein IFR05_004811 [Cadophora sp. M221]|nr:hypothetical protein IFR05_004811 [Cadophora sp. M221]
MKSAEAQGDALGVELEVPIHNREKGQRCVTLKLETDTEMKAVLSRGVLSRAFKYTKIDTNDGGTIDAYVEATNWLDAGFGLAQWCHLTVNNLTWTDDLTYGTS